MDRFNSTLLVVAVFCILSCGKKSHNKNSLPTSDTSSLKEVTCTCKDTTVITDDNQSELFAKASKVELAYFDLPSEEFNIIDTNQIKDGKFAKRDLKKTKYINKSEIKKLEKILYNKKRVCTDGDVYIPNDYIYQPHHAIILYNSNQKAFAYLEISFISAMSTTSKHDDFGPMCDETFLELEAFFNSFGVHP